MIAQHTLNREPQLIDIAIKGAHNISNRLFLFEAVKMSENDIRAILAEQGVQEKAQQDQYIEFVHMYRIASI